MRSLTFLVAVLAVLATVLPSGVDAAPNYDMVVSACGSLFREGKRLRFTCTNAPSETLGYATAGSNTRITSQPSITEPIFVTSGMLAPTNEWTVTSVNGNQFQLKNNAGKYLGICESARLIGAPLQGYYPQLKSNAFDERTRWTFVTVLDRAPTCRVSLRNVVANKQLAVCPPQQCPRTTGVVQAQPAVVAAIDNQLTFDVTEVGAPIVMPQHTTGYDMPIQPQTTGYDLPPTQY